MIQSNKTKLLALSLIFNFIFLGYIVSACYLSNLSNSSLTSTEISKIKKYKYIDISVIENSDIPDHKKKLIIETFDNLKEYDKNKYLAIRSLYHEIREVMSAKDFDEKAYRNNLKKIQILRSEMSLNFHETVIKLLHRLDGTQRAVLSQSFKSKARDLKSFPKSKPNP